MSDLVGNSKDRFSQDVAQIDCQSPDKLENFVNLFYFAVTVH